MLAAAALGGAAYLGAPLSGARAAADVTAATMPIAQDDAAQSPRSKGPVVVGLGDSVPAGYACSCTDFVAAYAAMAASATGTTTTVRNDAVSGSTSADVIDQLTTAAVAAQIRAATTVLLMTGANDFGSAFSAVSDGAPAAATYAPVAAAVQANVTTIVKRIHALNGRAHVVVLDYWAAMKDGAVAEVEYDAAAMTAAAQSTTAVNDALTKAALATGATYVSTYLQFNGADGANDPTSLLADDGDHPNAAGHLLIAEAVLATLPTG
jgi:acyl-CoA thioesterase-1